MDVSLCYVVFNRHRFLGCMMFCVVLYIQETPLPGAYDVHERDNFVVALSKKRHTYRFKSDGRKLDPQFQIGKGAMLLPGAYQYQDFEK